jgi:hypothetical protein
MRLSLSPPSYFGLERQTCVRKHAMKKIGGARDGPISARALSAVEPSNGIRRDGVMGNVGMRIQLVEPFFARSRCHRGAGTT